jgi:predicted S18 family serine protease
VDGIPEKIKAAEAVGKKVIGIPAGQAKSRSADGQPVENLRLGRDLGVEVREVRDLYDAYALLTGKELPRPRALSASRMEVPPPVASRLRERIRKLLDRAEADGLAARESRIPAVRGALGRLEVARREADVAAAYLRAARAAALAQAAVLVESLGGQGKRFEGSMKRVDASLADLEKSLAAMAEAPGARALALLSGYSGAVRARGFLEVARLLTGGADKSARARRSLRELVRTGRAFLPAIYVSYADLAAEIGRDSTALGGSVPARLRVDPKVLRRMARSYVSAATGNLEYIDALLLAEVAEEQKKPVETVRMAFGINEPAYLLAMQLAEMALLGEVSGTPTIGSRLLRLAAAAMSYVESALIVAKYYSLEAVVPERAPPEDVRRKQPLLALLGRSELAARRAAGWAVSRIGVVPPEAQLYYRAGASLVGGSVREKLRALGFFWQSTVASNVAAMVIRR